MRSILFSPAMVRALLAGRKAQTRRLVKDGVPAPLEAGVRAYVKESVRLVEREHVPYFEGEDPRIAEATATPACAVYVADESIVPYLQAWPWKLRTLPSMFMPQGLRRLELKITGVRSERLQEISKADAIAEGSLRFDDIPDPHPYKQGNRWSMESPRSTEQCLGSPQMAFANYFIQLHGQETWDSNPLVWAISFELHHREES